MLQASFPIPDRGQLAARNGSSRRAMGEILVGIPEVRDLCPLPHQGPGAGERLSQQAPVCACAQRTPAALSASNGVYARRARRVSPTTTWQLLQTFADQAVIAIENVRLFNETQGGAGAADRDGGYPEGHRFLSPSDVLPVFEAIASSANRLIGGFSAAAWRFADGMVHLAALTPTTAAADDALRAAFPRPIDDFVPFRLGLAGGEPAIIPDTEDLAHLPIREGGCSGR